ncbi:MAG: bis-aminopropyl spermidine synthase family protein [bacterium]|nr:bis-aminopropyl spermidine synthase family protein [bacterium]
MGAILLSPVDVLLASVAADARLAEGPEGVRRVFRAVFREGPIPLRDLARRVRLPVPVLAAVRGELEKRKLLERKGGIGLTEAGLRVAQDDLGLSCQRCFPRPVYPELTSELEDLRLRMSEICAQRPRVDVRLDQSHATPETALRRAIYLYENDALEGRDVLVLGDDDLTSLAIGILVGALGLRLSRLTVVEVDERLVDFLKHAAGEFPVEVVQANLREELPQDLRGQFDVFLTDPPYTLPGLDLFVSRGVEALRPGGGQQVFLCYGNRTPEEAASAVASVAQMGLAPVEILPDFNQYVGAQVLAGVSQMIRAVSTPQAVAHVQDAYCGPLYTADLKRARNG